MNNPELLSYQLTPIDTLCEYQVPYRVPLVVGDVRRILKPTVKPGDFDREFFTLVATSFSCDVSYINSMQLMLPACSVVSQILEDLNPEEALVIFPGEGAKAVLGDNLTNSPILNKYETVFVPTRRTIENGKVTGVAVDLPDELKYRLQEDGLNKIVIVDDVVATGKTLNALRQSIRKASLQPLDFSAFAWFCRKPSCVFDYQTVKGLYTYWTAEGYPALNTISTWLKGDAKSQAVLEGIKRKYVRYPYGFEKQLDLLRKMTVYSPS